MKKVRDGYKITELGEIPSDWNIMKLSEVAEIVMGQSPDSSSYNDTEDGVAFFQGKTEFGRINPVVKKWCNNPTKISKPLDILISVRAPVGDVNINNIEACIGRGLGAIRATSSSNYKYLYYAIQKYNNQLKKASQGSTFEAINSNDLKGLKLPIPHIDEQEKIALILSNVDEQIDNVDALIEKNKELKKGLMQTLLTKGIGHTKFKKTEIGEIPEEWDVIKFFDFVDKIIDFRGRTPKKLGMDWGNGDIQALSANNVKMGKIDFSLECYLASEELYEKWMSGNELKNGDIIMTMEAPLGNVALVPDERKYILSQRVIALKTKDFINNKFMKYMLMSDGVQRQLETLSTGTTAKGINQKNLARVYVKIPMIKEQEKIASILFKIDEKIEEYQNKKQKLEEIKKGLMQQLLTGKIRVL